MQNPVCVRTILYVHVFIGSINFYCSHKCYDWTGLISDVANIVYSVVTGAKVVSRIQEV